MSEVGIGDKEGVLKMLDGGLITETVRRLSLVGTLERRLLLSKGGGNIYPLEAHLFPHLCKSKGCSRGMGRAK